MFGANTFGSLLLGGSKRQGCVSHSTPEAEIVAADATLRNYGSSCIEHLGDFVKFIAQVVVS